MITEMVAPPQLTRAQVRDRIAAAAADRDAGMALADLGDAERGGWFTGLIDQAIIWWAQTGEEFSTNDLRDLLPPVPSSGLMGSRFTSAWKVHIIQPAEGLQGLIGVTSTDRGTHGKRIGLWIGGPAAHGATVKPRGRQRKSPPGRHVWREQVVEAWSCAYHAWWLEREAVAIGYATEMREFEQQHPAPRLKDFMIGLSQGQPRNPEEEAMAK